MQTTDKNIRMAPPATTELTLRQRLMRVAPYFGNQRLAWSLAILATLVGAITEPLIPALLQPLLDNGFTEGSLNLWMVPLFIIGLFFIRGIAQFTGQYALSRIANEGMLRLRKDLFERVQVARMDLFSTPKPDQPALRHNAHKQ